MSIFTKRGKRIVAGSLAGALALSVSPIIGLTGIASAADALPPIADPIGAGNFCDNAPTTEPFTDVSASDPGIDEIICLVATGLTKGVTPTTYQPNASITRRQMAIFIKRTADLANTLDTGSNIAPLPAYDGAPDFLDIAGESAEAKEAIGQLVQADIVQGTTATTYSPGAPVSRRQMAAFINRLQDFLTGDPFTTTGDFFNDDNGDTGEANLNAVASVGIFQGDGAGNVAPGGNLTRRQMAFVLLRHLQVAFDAGDISGAFAPATNATLTSDGPEGAAIQTFNADLTGVKAVTYTFSGLDDAKTYDVALFPVNYGGGYEDSVTMLETGHWMFRDQDQPFDGFADDECNTSYGDSEIVSINGVAVGSDCEYDVSPEDGELEIRLTNSTDAADSAFLVVWQDTGTDDDELKLDAADKPTEPFGVVGPIVWTAGECLTSTDAYGYALYVDKAANSIVLSDADCTVFYDEADDYFYDDEITSSLTDFESFLNNGDYIETEDLSTDDDYSRTQPNNWDLQDDYPGTPTGVVATATGSDVTVTWNAPLFANMEEDDNGYAGYCINLWDASDDSNDYSFCADYNDATAATDAVINNRTYKFLGVAPDTYYATVYAYSASGDSGDYSDPSADVTSPAPNSAVPGAPKTLAVPSGAFHTDGDGNGTVSAGDTLVFTFNEPVADPAAAAQLTLADGDGTIGVLINGTNATFSKSGANRILVLVTAPGPIIVAPGGTASLAYTALFVADPTGDETTGIKDLDEGLEWDVAGSGDFQL